MSVETAACRGSYWLAALHTKKKKQKQNIGVFFSSTNSGYYSREHYRMPFRMWDKGLCYEDRSILL